MSLESRLIEALGVEPEKINWSDCRISFGITDQQFVASRDRYFSTDNVEEAVNKIMPEVELEKIEGEGLPDDDKWGEEYNNIYLDILISGNVPEDSQDSVGMKAFENHVIYKYELRVYQGSSIRIFQRNYGHSRKWLYYDVWEYLENSSDMRPPPYQTNRAGLLMFLKKIAHIPKKFGDSQDL